MTAGDTGLSGSSNDSESSSRSADTQANSSAMSATTIYSAPYYPPAPSSFAPSTSNPSHTNRRPSQHGLHGVSAQFPPPSGTFVSDPHSAIDNRTRITATPLPPSASMQQFLPETSQPPVLRTNPTTPVSHTISEPHPRISTFSTPNPPTDPPIQLDIVHHPVSDIVTMLATKLQKLITASDRVKHSSSSSGTAFSTPSSNKPDGRLLSFHARNIPSITITAYLNRILKYCPTDPEVFISVLVYFDRILRIASTQAQPIFGAYYTSYDPYPTPVLVHNSTPQPAHLDETFLIDSFNVHRLVITTIAVATKFFSDQFYTNSRYARVGGLPLAELNHLEIQFLILPDFNLMIPPAEMQFYADELLRFWLVEQQRSSEKSFMGIIPPQPPTNVEYTPVTPATPGSYFSTPTTYVPTAAPGYPAFHGQYTQPMEGIQSTFPPHHNPSNPQ